MEPIFAAVLAGDLSQITAAAAAQRMEEDLLVPQVHWLYRGDTPLHLAAAGLRHDAAHALLSVGAPVDAVNRRGAGALSTVTRFSRPSRLCTGRNSSTCGNIALMPKDFGSKPS